MRRACLAAAVLLAAGLSAPAVAQIVPDPIAIQLGNGRSVPWSLREIPTNDDVMRQATVMPSTPRPTLASSPREEADSMAKVALDALVDKIQEKVEESALEESGTFGLWAARMGAVYTKQITGLAGLGDLVPSLAMFGKDSTLAKAGAKLANWPKLFTGASDTAVVVAEEAGWGVTVWRGLSTYGIALYFNSLPTATSEEEAAYYKSGFYYSSGHGGLVGPLAPAPGQNPGAPSVGPIVISIPLSGQCYSGDCCDSDDCCPGTTTCSTEPIDNGDGDAVLKRLKIKRSACTGASPPYVVTSQRMVNGRVTIVQGVCRPQASK